MLNFHHWTDSKPQLSYEKIGYSIYHEHQRQNCDHNAYQICKLMNKNVEFSVHFGVIGTTAERQEISILAQGVTMKKFVD